MRGDLHAFEPNFFIAHLSCPLGSVCQDLAWVSTTIPYASPPFSAFRQNALDRRRSRVRGPLR